MYAAYGMPVQLIEKDLQQCILVLLLPWKQYPFKRKIRESRAKLILLQINEREARFNSTRGWQYWSNARTKHAQRLKTLTRRASHFVERLFHGSEPCFDASKARARAGSLATAANKASSWCPSVIFNSISSPKLWRMRGLCFLTTRGEVHCGSLNQSQRRVNRDFLKHLVVALSPSLDIHETIQAYETHNRHCSKHWNSLCLTRNRFLPCLIRPHQLRMPTTLSWRQTAPEFRLHIRFVPYRTALQEKPIQLLLLHKDSHERYESLWQSGEMTGRQRPFRARDWSVPCFTQNQCHTVLR